MYSANINLLGAVGYLTTTEPPNWDVEAQNLENYVWTKYMNPEIQLKSTHGRWSRWWSMSVTAGQGCFPFFRTSRNSEGDISAPTVGIVVA